jgi:endonuclease YncB( thermonuclease family)
LFERHGPYQRNNNNNPKAWYSYNNWALVVDKVTFQMWSHWVELLCDRRSKCRRHQHAEGGSKEEALPLAIIGNIHNQVTDSDATDTVLRAAQFHGVEEVLVQGTFDCKVVRIYDGDTVWVALRPHYTYDALTTQGKKQQHVGRLCCRLLGIDAPEMPRSHVDVSMHANYYKRAFAARNRLVELVTSCQVCSVEPPLSDHLMQKVVDCNTAVLKNGLELLHKKDKYGRYLARIKTLDGRDASDVMLDEGHAVPYDGGHRDPPFV